MDNVLIDGKKIAQDFERYRKIIQTLQGDVPIQTLCLPSRTEKILIRSGCLRVYDVINMDLTKIKGLGNSGRAFLASRLNEFLSVSL